MKTKVEFKPLVDVMLFSEDEGKSVPARIKLVPVGKFKTQAYGQVNISKDDLDEMAKNFTEGVRAGVPIDVDHEHKKAAGWIRTLTAQEDGLWGEVDWTRHGKDLLENREYRFLSPEFATNYVAQEDSSERRNVLIAASLVNFPMFQKSLNKPLVASEDGTKEEVDENLTKIGKGVMIFIEPETTTDDGSKDQQTMNLEDVLKTPKADRSEEQNKFLTDHQEELTPEQKAAEGITAKTEEAAPAATETTTETKTETTEPVTAKEGQSVTITASELQSFRETQKKLDRKEIEEDLAQFTFSEKGGKFSKNLVPTLADFVQGLSKEQRVAFSEVMKKLPDQKIFGEVGSDEDMTESQEADATTASLIKKHTDTGKTFGEALALAQKENPQAFVNYQANLDKMSKGVK